MTVPYSVHDGWPAGDAARDEIGAPRFISWMTPWMSDGVTMTGRALAEFGLQIPTLWPNQALVLHAVAVDANTSR